MSQFIKFNMGLLGEYGEFEEELVEMDIGVGLKKYSETCPKDSLV